MEEPLLTLQPIKKAKTGYEIKDYDRWLAIATEYAEDKLKAFGNELVSDFDKKECKRARADLRKKAEQAKQARLSANNGLLGTFNMQLKAIEKTFTKAEEVLKSRIEAYEKKPIEDESPTEPKSLVLKIAHLDYKVLDTIKEFALSLGATIIGD